MSCCAALERCQDGVEHIVPSVQANAVHSKVAGAVDFSDNTVYRDSGVRGPDIASMNGHEVACQRSAGTWRGHRRNNFDAGCQDRLNGNGYQRRVRTCAVRINDVRTKRMRTFRCVVPDE